MRLLNGIHIPRHAAGDVALHCSGGPLQCGAWRDEFG
jgi:hypothetical protein